LSLHRQTGESMTCSMPCESARICARRNWPAMVGVSRSRLTDVLQARDWNEHQQLFPANFGYIAPAQLLITTHLSIKEIRNKAGISDGSNFVRDFKKRFGLTPSAYRKTLPQSFRPTNSRFDQ